MRPVAARFSNGFGVRERIVMRTFVVPYPVERAPCFPVGVGQLRTPSVQVAQYGAIDGKGGSGRPAADQAGGEARHPPARRAQPGGGACRASPRRQRIRAAGCARS